MSTKDEITEYYINFNMFSESLVEKWAKTGLLEGLNAQDMSQNKMAVLLENQVRQIYADKERGKQDSEFDATIILPVLRRVYGKYVKYEKFHVAPMPAYHVPIDGDLIAVATFVEKFEFPQTISMVKHTYSGMDSEAEFCECLLDVVDLAIAPIIDASKVVLMFMPFASALTEHAGEDVQSTGFTTRWYHELPE